MEEEWLRAALPEVVAISAELGGGIGLFGWCEEASGWSDSRGRTGLGGAALVRCGGSLCLTRHFPADILSMVLDGTESYLPLETPGQRDGTCACGIS